ncbi:DnaJ domain-containing protein [Prauserella alba]|uniref:DnaJ domain-containing protein n=1 Tax=Prauserella alba TaxID=176898 RepID=A0ABN1V4Y0_9PSEU|nr:DnaJ domain-containing protein [Prauserella alba]MCP2180419.1 Nuclease-related domain-containing protein [Prauserella alba]
MRDDDRRDPRPDAVADDPAGGEVDFYDLLGVPDDATSSQIKSAFRARARNWHPDAGGDARRFALLREAYDTLTDPALRAAYDGTDAPGGTDDGEPAAPEGPLATADPDPVPPRRPRTRAFGDDPSFRPPRVRLDPEAIPWWDAAAAEPRTQVSPGRAPGHAVPALAPAVTCAVTLLLVLAGAPAPVVAAGVAATVAAIACVAVHLHRRHTALRTARAEVREVVFGSPGADDDQIAERRTADLLDRYLTRLPGARIFHGLAWPGSVFADVDHAVLCGRRLLLVESKRWLPGHYTVGEDDVLHRNGRRFGGGGSRLAEALDAFEGLLPGIEIRGALVLYPSRAGTITVGPAGCLGAAGTDVAVLTPQQFVRDAGTWLAEDPSTVDVRAFRAVLAQVVS